MSERNSVSGYNKEMGIRLPKPSFTFKPFTTILSQCQFRSDYAEVAGGSDSLLKLFKNTDNAIDVRKLSGISISSILAALE